MKTLYTFAFCLLIMCFTGCTSKDASNLDYWSTILYQDSQNEQLNAFSFEEKYKIIERAYNQQGFYCNYSYDALMDQKDVQNFLEELSNEAYPIHVMAYWIIEFWGRAFNIPRSAEESFHFVKLSDQIWSHEGEQGDLVYLEYLKHLLKMAPNMPTIENWEQSYISDSIHYQVAFSANGKPIEWTIESAIGGSIDQSFFDLFVETFQSDYKKDGEYYLIMENGGGIVLFLDDAKEHYLRTLWNFPKLNQRGKLMTLKEYAQL